MKSNFLKLMVIGGLLLVSVAVLAQSKPTGGQASITLWSCNASPCYENNVSWTLGKCEGANCQALPASPLPDHSYAGEQGETITLNPDGSSPTMYWNVKAQSVSISGNTLKVFGFLNIQNTGTATAYFGSFVANLQKKTGNTWTSVAADLANSYVGPNAPQVNICSTASSEGLSSFSPTSGVSQGLKLYDSSGNDLTAFPFQLAAGAPKVVLYEADFNIANTGLAPGQQVRLEAIVTFANSGARGGSGASCTNSTWTSNAAPGSYVDINGDGTYESYEYYYRSVPCRSTITIPNLTTANASVVFSDPTTDANNNLLFNSWGIDPNTNVLGLWTPWNSTSPTEPAPGLTALPAGLTAVNLAGLLPNNAPGGAVAPGSTIITSATSTIGNSATLNYSGPSSVSGQVTATATTNGVAGIDNCATLKNPNGDDLVVVNDPLLNTDPHYVGSFTFTCNKATKLEACAWPILVPDPVQNPTPVASCSYSQGGWHTQVHGGDPGFFLTNNFNTVYPATPHSVSVGTGNSMTFSDVINLPVQVCTTDHKTKLTTCVTNYITETAPQAIENYLPGNGPSGPLTTSLVDPTSSSAGEFGGQVLALQLSVDFSAYQVKNGTQVGWTVPNNLTPVALGSVYYIVKGSCEYNQTVQQILTDANTLLGGGTVAGCSIAQMDSILTDINEGFDGCATGDITKFSATKVSN